ncbi:hypothetical protein HOD30_03020 [Candidatus Peregrinibacteria bacterium]|jgi:hypothetical protein|nr:hypothetical protein [Candidatus Peregrinibacteria bacterium]MBT4632066.1 hypothetical protein [Candidatus Peregrinibacteria bacterium]MBT5516299.1 hypothetical protein [Candidatus Peregrinibacteria bacterium]MBT5823720.1 hypothetical protein [Candidatus Peregrinibacteria bacterium]
MKNPKKFTSRFLENLKLDLISIPSKFMSKEGNAKYHLKYLCPKCPNWRKNLRDPKGKDNCLWNKTWKEKDGFNKITRHFGIKNWLTSYLGYTQLGDKDKWLK